MIIMILIVYVASIYNNNEDEMAAESGYEQKMRGNKST